MTDQEIVVEAKRITSNLREGKILVMRRPPWFCPYCGTYTVNDFKWVGDCFECTCERCNNVCYS